MTLQVFDERDDKHLLVVQRPHQSRNRCPAETLNRPESPLAHDDLERVSHGPDDDRLQQAVLADGVREFREAGRVEVAAGLERIRLDGFDRNLRLRRDAIRPEVVAQQGRKPLPETALVPGQL